MIKEKILANILARTIIGAGLVLIPASITVSTAAIAQEVEAEADIDESKFLDREALGDILFGDQEGAVAELDTAIADLNSEITDLQTAITAKEAEVAAETDATLKAALQVELDGLNTTLTGLNTDLENLNTDLTALNEAQAAQNEQLAALTDEQVFALNRSFNGWVNNAFDVTLSDELIALLLSGELNDKQVMFAIRAEFGEAKFNQLADKMEEKGLTDQADRMRDHGAVQKDKFNGKVDGFAAGDEVATSAAKSAAQYAARDSAKENANNAAKGQAKADAKSAAKDEARQNAKEEARKNAKNMGRGQN